MSSPFRCGRLARAPCKRTEATWIVECSSGTVQCSAGVSRSPGPSTRWVFKPPKAVPPRDTRIRAARREGRAGVAARLQLSGDLQARPTDAGWRPYAKLFRRHGRVPRPSRHDRPDSQSREPASRDRRLDENPVVVPTGLEYDADPAYIGGCTKLVVDRRHDGKYELLDDFAILGGTDNNCAGGVAPVPLVADMRGGGRSLVTGRSTATSSRWMRSPRRRNLPCRSAVPGAWRTKRPCGAAESCTRRRIAASSRRPPLRRAARASTGTCPTAAFAGQESSPRVRRSYRPQS